MSEESVILMCGVKSLFMFFKTFFLFCELSLTKSWNVEAEMILSLFIILFPLLIQYNMYNKEPRF